MQNFSPAEKTILIVDDESEICEYLLTIFEAEGYKTRVANSGNQAWKLVENEPIDVVITDVMMGDGDGIELLDRIRSRSLDKPTVILMSGFAKISVAEAYERGAEAFFPKPFKPGAMVETVKQSLLNRIDRWSARRTNERIPAPERLLSLNVSVPDLLSAAYNASIVNFGRGGMFLAWGEKLPRIGEMISFEISFMGEPTKKFSGNGVVRWVRDERDKENRLPGFGIEFTQLGANNAVDIIEVLNYLKTKEFIPRS